MSTYVVFPDAGCEVNNITVVEAESEEQAKRKGLKEYYIQQTPVLFKEWVMNKSMNASLIKAFCQDEQGYLFNSCGEYREDLVERYTEEQIRHYIRRHFEKNVMNFFRDHRDFSQIYLDYFFDHNKNDYNTDFPLDMYEYILLHTGYVPLSAKEISVIR